MGISHSLLTIDSGKRQHSVYGQKALARHSFRVFRATGYSIRSMERPLLSTSHCRQSVQVNHQLFDNTVS